MGRNEFPKAWIFFIAAISLLVASQTVCAENYLMIDSGFDPLYEDYAINSMYFITNENPFYGEEVFYSVHHEPWFSDTDRLVFYDSSGKVLIDRYVQLQDISAIPYGGDMSEIASFKLFRDDEVYLEKKTNFCDNDGVCEPCVSKSCTDYETYLTCSDCSSGSYDGYCDLKRDGVCDADCSYMDGDCPLCGALCLYDDMSGKSCSELGGELCDPQQSCYGGSFAFVSADLDFCCFGGSCVDMNEYVESMAQLESQPSMTITESGDFASTIKEQGFENYCESRLKGKVCAAYEACSGREVEFYPGKFCCMASCSLLPENQTVPDQQDIMEAEDIALPVEESDFRLVGGTYDYNFTNESEYPAENYEGLPEGEFPHESLEDMPAETPDVISTETLSSVADSAGQQLDKVNLIHVSIIAFAVLFVIVVCIGLFRRSANAKMGVEQKQAPSADLQSEIDLIVSQGNNYNQAEQMLLQRGYDKASVDAEIRKNYQKRLELQQRMARK
ncbi:hypothetical protein KY363_04045 [Candidatus Woesearchaeota archaeon]|nr:hypothetical protein [Candidatus Woesearchaeota archaeon]